MRILARAFAARIHKVCLDVDGKLKPLDTSAWALKGGFCA